MEAIREILGTTMLLLLSISFILAIVMLVLLQTRWIVRLTMLVYWRWKASIRQLREDFGEPNRHGKGLKNRPDPRRDGPRPDNGVDHP